MVIKFLLKLKSSGNKKSNRKFFAIAFLDGGEVGGLVKISYFERDLLPSEIYLMEIIWLSK